MNITFPSIEVLKKKCLFDPGCRDTCSSRQVPEAVARSYSVKKVFVKILQNSQENTCARVSFLIKLQAWGLTESEKGCWHHKSLVIFYIT